MVRFKNRYLLFEILPIKPITTPEINERDLTDAIKISVLDNFGDLGLSKVQYSLQVKYYNNSTRIGIVRVSREYLNILWTSIIFITKITKKEDIALKIRILDSKATLKRIEVSLKRKSRFWMYNTMKYFDLEEEIQRELIINQEKSFEAIKSLDP